MEWYFRASLRKIWLLCVCLLGYILFFLFYSALCVRITAFVAKTLFWLTILNFRASFAHVSFGNRIWTVKNLHILCLENINRNIACGWKCRNYVIFIYHVVCDYYNFLSHTKKEHKHIHTRRSRTNSFGFLQNPLLFFMGSEWTELKFFTPKKKMQFVQFLKSFIIYSGMIYIFNFQQRREFHTRCDREVLCKLYTFDF